MTHTSVAGDATYRLTITENTSRAAYAPQTGDTYVLTITRAGSTRTSSGTVIVSAQGGNTILSLSGGVNLSVTITSGGGMTRIEGTITTNAGSEEAPGEVSPGTTTTPGENSVVGSWRSINEGIIEEDREINRSTFTLTLRTDNTFTITHLGEATTMDGVVLRTFSSSDNGTYSVAGNIITMNMQANTWGGRIDGNRIIIDSGLMMTLAGEALNMIVFNRI